MQNNKLPLGTKDELGPTAEKKEKIIDKLFEQFKTYGFERIKTPILEYVDVFNSLAKSNYKSYQMLDRNNKKLVLRPDLTLPIARVMSSSQIKPPVKWYYSGDVFRLKQKLSGNYDQFTQAGIEIIGYQSIKAEWECLMIALDGFDELGLDDLTLELGDSRLAEVILSELPLPKPTKEALKTNLYNKNLSRYQELITPLLNTEYGYFLKNWPWLFGDFDQVMKTLKTIPMAETLKSIVYQLVQTKRIIETNYQAISINLDLSSPAPQKYYTGMTFRIYTKESSNYIASGGRYDNLLKDFQQRLEPAVGIGFNIDTIMELFSDINREDKALIYFENNDWPKAKDLLKRMPNSSLCLADSLSDAKRIAAQKNYRLINISNQKVVKNVD